MSDRGNMLRKKGFRDLFLEKGRTFLVAAAVFIGVFGSSIVMTSYGILNKNIKPNYRATNPSSIIIETSALDPGQLNTLRATEGIEDVERRGRIRSRLEMPDGSLLPLVLFIVDDFSDIRVAKLFPEEGAWPPAADEILFERVALPVSGYRIGDSVAVRVPGRETANLRISGTTHDPGQAPAWMEGMVYGYITREAAEERGWTADTETYQLTVDFDIFDSARINALTADIKSSLAASDAEIVNVVLPVPDEHPHERQMKSLLLLQVSFGILALMLSAVISATMISAFLEGQIRQIAILKTVGGTRMRLVRHYLSVISVPVAAAVATALPLGIILGGRFSAFFAGLLNFNIMYGTPPVFNLLLQAVLGFTLPLGISLIPILRGCGMTAREALAHYGIARNVGRRKSRTSGRNAKLRLAISGMIRKRGRFILTVLTLTVGGMLFMTALNVRTSMSETVVNQFARQKQDAFFILNDFYPSEVLADVIDEVDEVTEAEYWINRQVSLQDLDSEGVHEVNMWAVPEDSDYFQEIVYSGSWSPDMDEPGIAVNEMLLESIPGFGLGQEIDLATPEGLKTFTVTAVLRQPMVPPRMYVPLSELIGETDSFNMLMLAGETNGPAAPSIHGGGGHFGGSQSGLSVEKADRLMIRMENALQDAGIDAITAYQMAEMEKIAKDHMQMASLFLLLLSFLSLFIGGISLTMTLALNIRDQKRETAVVKAVGAGKKALSQLIRRQSVFTAVSAWALSLVAAWPASIALSNYFGRMFFESNLDFVYAHPGPVLWGIISFLLALFAAAKPLKEVLNLSVTRTLRYE